MLSRWMRTWDTKVLRPLLVLLVRCGITPNMLTLGSLVAAVAAGLALAGNRPILGATLLLLGLFLDGIDGELAREVRSDSPVGAFLDSITDHCGDFAAYFGLLWLSLHANRIVDVFLIFSALFGSVFGSHVRSRAGMVGIDTKDVGLFTRTERVLVLALGLCTRRTTLALWVLAVLNNVSAFQRIWATLQAARRMKLSRTCAKVSSTVGGVAQAISHD